MVDNRAIEKRILQISDLVREIAVEMRDGRRIARIYPDLGVCKKERIINIENEIRWYAVELYNIDPIAGCRIDGYEIVNSPLLERPGKIVCGDEPGDETYVLLKRYLESVSEATVCPQSHLELDLGLDSLEYVKLFTFIEQSFGVMVDEAVFAERMVLAELYAYVREQKIQAVEHAVSWEQIIGEPIDYRLKHSPWILRIFKSILLPLFRLYFRLEISGEEHLPQSPFIIAPSHQSMLDGFIIAAALPYGVLEKTFYLAYEGEFGKWFMRPVARNGQLIMIDVNHNLKRSLQRTAVPLKQGENVVIFPEGARSRDGKLLEFRPFYAILAKELDVPVVPVLLDGTFEAMKAGRRFPRPAKVRLQYLPPLYPKERDHETINLEVKAAIAKAMGIAPLR